MAQKVQFIAAVIARPRLLILDEPFTGLDPINMELLRNAVRVGRIKTATTVILSTHDMDMAERLCDSIFMIYRGKKVLDGTPAAIQAQFSQDTIRLRTADAHSALPDLPGVLSVNDQRRYKELRIGRDADPRVILQALSQHAAVEYFELARPSLHDIFVHIAGPASSPTRRGNMRKIWIIAVREYRAMVATKAFLIMLVLMPVMMGGGIFIQERLRQRLNLGDKRLVVLDQTGVLFKPLFAAAEDRNQKAIFAHTGAQIGSRYRLEQGPDGPITDRERLELSARIRPRRNLRLHRDSPGGPHRRHLRQRCDGEIPCPEHGAFRGEGLVPTGSQRRRPPTSAAASED